MALLKTSLATPWAAQSAPGSDVAGEVIASFLAWRPTMKRYGIAAFRAMKSTLHIAPRNAFAAAQTAVLLSVAGPALASNDTVRLEVIPLHSGIECDRIFFESSDRFPNTIFVMPRVEVGMTKNGNDLFSIDPDGQGGYVMSLGLYFPRDGETFKGSASAGKASDGRCNMEVVQHSLNKNRSPEKQIKTIASLPLISMEVRVPGVEAVGTNGRSEVTGEEVDVLDYQGVGYPVELKLTETERSGVMTRLKRNQGLPIKVLMRFKARSHNGSLTAEIKMSEVSKAFAFSAKGKPKLIAKAEAKVMIASALKSQSLKITVEEGAGELNKLANDLMDKFLKDASLTATTPTIEGESASSAADLVEVAAMAKFLSSQATISVNHQVYGKAATATGETTVNLETQIQDPRVRQIAVTAKEADPTLDDAIGANMRVKISAAYTRLVTTEYVKKDSYLTKNQIDELGLLYQFDDLATGKMVIENQEVNGRLMGIGKWSVSSADAWLPLYTAARYRWRRTERSAVRSYEPSERIDASLNALKRFPIYVTFSRLGRKLYPLAELIGDHEDFSAVFDRHGSIVITSKADLGLMTLRESFSGDDVKLADVDTDEVVQERRSPTGTPSYGTPKALKSQKRMPVLQRMVVLYVSRPERIDPATLGSALGAPAAMPMSSRDSEPVYAPAGAGGSARD